jgi:hypothetical protein
MSFQFVFGATLRQQLWHATTTLTIEASIFRDHATKTIASALFDHCPFTTG